MMRETRNEKEADDDHGDELELRMAQGSTLWHQHYQNDLFSSEFSPFVGLLLLEK